MTPEPRQSESVCLACGLLASEGGCACGEEHRRDAEVVDLCRAPTHVIARCIGCGQARKIVPDEIKPGDVPICGACFSPMVAESSEAR